MSLILQIAGGIILAPLLVVVGGAALALVLSSIYFIAKCVWYSFLIFVGFIHEPDTLIAALKKSFSAKKKRSLKSIRATVGTKLTEPIDTITYPFEIKVFLTKNPRDPISQMEQIPSRFVSILTLEQTNVERTRCFRYLFNEYKCLQTLALNS